MACSRESTKATAETAASAGAAGGQLALPADTTPPKELDGTRWRLVEVQSTSNPQGSFRPQQPSKYTINFDSEGGFLSMEIDCNRASANYERTRDADRRGGTLKIEPLRITRAQCPASSLGDRLVADMGNVRQYRFANGRLALSPSGNGAIYVWERQQ